MVSVDLGRRYTEQRNEKDLITLWKKWHGIHKACATAVKDAPTHFDLSEACPRLARYRNMRYSVPGESQFPHV